MDSVLKLHFEFQKNYEIAQSTIIHIIPLLRNFKKPDTKYDEI